VPRFSRPLREAGKFADIPTNREGKKPGRHDFSRAAKHQQCPRLPAAEGMFVREMLGASGHSCPLSRNDPEATSP
jgi:hypothetical protein